MSKRPRPVDPQQPDLFAPSGPQDDTPPARDAAPAARARPVRARPARPGRPEAASPDPPQADPAAASPAAAPAPAAEPLPAPAAAQPAPPRPPDPPPAAAQPDATPRPAFRRIDPLAPRTADRPDSFLYCVLTRDAADAVLRHGLPDENPPALVERGAVPRHLAATAEELGWSDEQPGALVVLRVRRTEVAPADAPPRTRRLA